MRGLTGTFHARRREFGLPAEVYVKRSTQMTVELTNDEARARILHYFYERNKNATSSIGKRGSAIKISDVDRRTSGAREPVKPIVPSEA